MNEWAEWFFYYCCYGFGGWLLENLYSRATTGVFWKEGFLFAPIKPMYGIAMIAMVAVRASGGSPLFLVFCSVAVPSAVEFAGGFLLDKGFGRRYWDYRSMLGNVEGYVCLAFSLCWVPLTLAGLYGLQPLLKALYGQVSSGWNAISPWLFALALVELAVVARKRTSALRIRRTLSDKHNEPAADQPEDWAEANGFPGEGSPEAGLS